MSRKDIADRAKAGEDVRDVFEGPPAPRAKKVNGAHEKERAKAANDVLKPQYPSEILRALIGAPEPVRLVTSIPTLDASLRGGIIMPRFVVIGGPPGSGKTGLSAYIAHQGNLAGHPCAWYAADEEPGGIVDRKAQAVGIPKHQIESRDEVGLERAAERLEALPFALFDQDAGHCLDHAIAWLNEQSKRLQKPGLLIVDSLQTLIIAGHEDDEPRMRINANIAAIKPVSTVHGHLVIATSEVARGAYRNRDNAANTDPLASGKESGSIEYSAQTYMMLRTVRDNEALVDVLVAKNRAGKKSSFRLRLDGVDYSEVPCDAEYEGGSRARVHHVDDDADEVRKILVRSPGLAGVAALRASLRANGCGMSNERVSAALTLLDQGGEIDRRGPANRPRLHLRSGGSEAPLEP
jgi:archaellum biogenesis ATPase FlaH